jgi:hypothetical protein
VRFLFHSSFFDGVAHTHTHTRTHAPPHTQELDIKQIQIIRTHSLLSSCRVYVIREGRKYCRIEAKVQLYIRLQYILSYIYYIYKQRLGTAAAAMVRYCCICRGEDELLLCTACKRCYHEECAKVRKSDIDDIAQWLCDDCSVLSDAELEKKEKVKSNFKSSFKHIKKWHLEIMQRRREFLHAKRPLLLPFCTEKKLDAVISKGISRASKGGERGAGAGAGGGGNSPDMDLSITETPHFIHAELRSYQLEGVSTLCAWAQRGVGGILSDEMVNFLSSLADLQLFLPILL